MMNHAIAIEENKTSHLTELDVLFSVLSLLDASIGMIEVWFQWHSHTPMIRPSYNLSIGMIEVWFQWHSHTPMIRPSYNLFEQICIDVERRNIS